MPMDWDKLRIFHAVAEAGSFTHAGDSLHLSQSAISRQISSLEDSLNCLLFHRHARGLLLTEQGELLYRTVHEVFAKLTMAEAKLNEAQDRPQGPLKISTTVGLGSLWLTPRIREFIDLYPDIEPPRKIPFARPMDQWLADWAGPKRSEFRSDLEITEYTGDQQWLLWCLEQFLDIVDGELS